MHRLSILTDGMAERQRARNAGQLGTVTFIGLLHGRASCVISLRRNIYTVEAIVNRRGSLAGDLRGDSVDCEALMDILEIRILVRVEHDNE